MQQYSLINRGSDYAIEAITHANSKEEAKAKFLASGYVEEIDFEGNQYTITQTYIEII